MSPIRVETTLVTDGTVVLHDLPFLAGDRVEVVIAVPTSPRPSYPLRGLAVNYVDPFEPIAADEWEATR